MDALPLLPLLNLGVRGDGYSAIDGTPVGCIQESLGAEYSILPDILYDSPYGVQGRAN
jgi:hypothetical protein